MRYAAVLPTYNGADPISGLLDQLVPVAQPGDPQVDVVVIADRSADGTGEIVQAHPEFGGRSQVLTRSTKDGVTYRAGASTLSVEVTRGAAVRVLQWRIGALWSRRTTATASCRVEAAGRR